VAAYDGKEFTDNYSKWVFSNIVIEDEQGVTVKEAWDGSNLRFTFRRIVDSRLMLQWGDFLRIAESIILREDEEDAIIWQFESSGRFSVQSLCAIVNNRGIRQILTPVVWKIIVPLRLHIFLWLLVNNKILTRDNLAKRKKIEENVHHVFFGCYVTRTLWDNISEILQPVGADFESVAKLWLNEKKFKSVNTCTSAIIWTL
jgi:hypothetical protein